MDGQPNYYVRGAGGVVLPARRVLAVVLALTVAALIVAILAISIVDLQHAGQRRALARNGIPVQVTVTGCVAEASGTGITQSGFSCRGRYQVAGRPYDAVLHGSSQQISTGTDIRAVTSTARPTELYSVASIRGDLSYRAALVVPMVLSGLLIAALACEFALLRRPSNRRPFSLGKMNVGATQNSASLQ